MKSIFKIHPLQYKTLEFIPEAWTSADYKQILELLDFDQNGISENELQEMCLLALSDEEPNEAAALLLKYRLSEKLNDGQIQNLSHDMLNDKMWEEYADMSCHEEIYNVNQLLFKAYNGKFPQPKIVQLTIEVTAKNSEHNTLLEDPAEAFVVRLLAGGLNEHNPLIRLFEEQLKGEHLAEAPSIIWRLKKLSGTNESTTLEVIGSAYWLEDYRDVADYETEAHVDEVEEEVA